MLGHGGSGYRSLAIGGAMAMTVGITAATMAGALASIPAADGRVDACRGTADRLSTTGLLGPLVTLDRKGTLRAIDTEAGEQCRDDELPLTFNVKGEQGVPGIPGAQGSPGAAGPPGAPGASTIMGGSTAVFGGNGGVTLAPSGQSEQAGGRQLSPSVPIVARDMAFRVSVAPGAGASTSITLVANENATPLGCTISDEATQCVSGTATALIDPASTLTIGVGVTNAEDPGAVSWAFRALTP